MNTDIVLADSGASLGRVNVASDLPAIFTLAKALSKAQGFIPQHLKSEGEIAAVVLAGMELGLQPMVALRSLSLIKGKVVLAADVQLALMIRAGAKVRWLSDGTDGHAKLEVTRNGQAPYVSQFSLDMARKAGLTGDNWQKHPAAMLRARCVSSAGRAIMPDVLAGCYVPGEIEDEPAHAKQGKPARSLDDVAQGGDSRPLASAAERSPAHAAAAVSRQGESPAHAHDEMTGEIVDEYGLVIPASACPIFQSGDDAGKPYIEANAHKLQALLDNKQWMSRASTPMVEWARYRVLRREREKELEEAEAAVAKQQQNEVEGEVVQ
jgi:hypothetical protein